LLVDIDAETSLARARARNLAAPHCETRMDDQSIEFHRKVYEAYHALAGASRSASSWWTGAPMWRPSRARSGAS